MECGVLRCGNPFQSVFNAGTTGSDLIEVPLCEQHQSQIDQGARWLYQWEDRCLLMGRDLPPHAVKVEAKGVRSSDGITRVFTFVVEDFEGNQRDVEFELLPEIAEGVWRVLGRDRKQRG